MSLPAIELDELEQSVQRQPLALRLLTIALQALSSRALVWVAFLGAVGLWTMVMLDPSWIKIAAAFGYCMTVLIMVIWRDIKGT